MSQAAANAASAPIYRTTVIMKVTMAVTGLIMVGFLVGHMIGNLQAFKFMGGKQALNDYAAMLKSLPALLWVARIVLLSSVVLHIWSAVTLTRLNQGARKTPYEVSAPKKATFASRTMVWTGPLLALYLIYHLLQFTIIGLNIDRFSETNVYGNVVQGFNTFPIALVYIVANVGVGIHLWHGLFSFFQSLGLSSPRHNALRRHFATVVSVGLTIGFLAVPFGVMFDLIK